MQILLYISLVYMVLHLSLLSFKKGEQFKLEWEEKYSPMYKENYLKNRIEKRKLKNIKIKAKKNNKYRLMFFEMEKGYNEPFSKEFIEAMTEERFANELFEEVKEIFDYKERNAYRKFPFDDKSKISRTLQFLNVKKEISQAQMQNFFLILFHQYEKGLMKEIEVKDWKPKFIKLGMLDEKNRPTVVNSISEALKMQENESDIKQAEDLPVVIREISKRKTARF